MKLLTVDTSTSACSVALSMGRQIVSAYVTTQGQTLSSRLLGCIEIVLQGQELSLQDLDGFGIAIGPGAFTGLRVGVATVKGLAFAAGKQVAGFSSLAMLAMNVPWADYPVCPMFDARKNEVYTGLYACKQVPVPLLPDRVVSPARFVESLEGRVIFVGEGAVRYRELIVATLGNRALFAPFPAHLPNASAGACLALGAFERGEAVSPELLAPAYIRPTEAELALMKS